MSGSGPPGGGPAPDGREPPGRIELAIAAFVFALLTAGLTYPQVLVLGTHMDPHHDTLFSVWRLAWVAHQLPRDPLRLFDANIFHPEPNTLAYSDAMILPGAASAPLIWVGAGPVAVHNLLLLGSFVACGTAMYALVRFLAGSPSAGAVAGAIYAFQPYRMGHYAHLELLLSWWIPLAFLALHRVVDHRRARDGIVLGLWIALQALCSIYYGVFLAIGIGVVAIALTAGRPRAGLARLAAPAAAAAVPVAVLLVPYGMPYRAALQAVGTRPVAEVREWSASAWDFLAVPPTNWLHGSVTGVFGHPEGNLFPGATTIALAAFALLARPAGRTALAYLLLAILSADLSLGANGLTYMTLYEHVPGLAGLRVSARFHALTSAALAVLAGLGVARLVPRAPRIGWRAAGLGALVLAEFLSAPVGLVEAPRSSKIYDWLAREPPAVIVEWPLPVASDLGHTQDPVYMFSSTRHWQRLVNGYSGFHPPSYIRFITRAAGFPDARALEAMREAGVGFIVLHERYAPARYADAKRRLADRADVRLVMAAREEDGEVSLYRLGAGGTP